MRWRVLGEVWVLGSCVMLPLVDLRTHTQKFYTTAGRELWGTAEKWRIALHERIWLTPNEENERRVSRQIYTLSWPLFICLNIWFFISIYVFISYLNRFERTIFRWYLVLRSVHSSAAVANPVFSSRLLKRNVRLQSRRISEEKKTLQSNRYTEAEIKVKHKTNTQKKRNELCDSCDLEFCCIKKKLIIIKGRFYKTFASLISCFFLQVKQEVQRVRTGVSSGSWHRESQPTTRVMELLLPGNVHGACQSLIHPVF